MQFSFQPGDERTKHICVYWEGSEGGSWSREGCSHVHSNDSYTKCKCFHLSSFAVLLALAPKVPRFIPVNLCMSRKLGVRFLQTDSKGRAWYLMPVIPALWRA